MQEKGTEIMEKNTWKEIRSRRVDDDPARDQGIRHERQLLDLAIRLAELRDQAGVSQRALGERLSMTQANVSRIEHEDDLHLSTVANYVAGLGGRLELRAVFDDEAVSLTDA